MGLKFSNVGVWAGYYWQMNFLEGPCISWGRTPRSLHIVAWISVSGVSTEAPWPVLPDGATSQEPGGCEGPEITDGLACRFHVTQAQAGTAKFMWNWRMIRVVKWIIHLQSSGSNQTRHVIRSLWRWLLGYKNSRLREWVWRKIDALLSIKLVSH